MKKGIIKGVQKIGNVKSYIPDETLVTFLQDWLQIHQKKEKLTLDGKALSAEDQTLIRNLDKKKVDYLDNLIFPAFANLTYFFEAMASSTRLSNAFEDELEEILDPRKSKDASRFGGGGMRYSSMSFRENNLVRLLNGMLEIPIDNNSRGEPTSDFRIGLMYQVLNIIGDKMDTLFDHEYSGNQVWKSFWEDYQRMLGWVALLTRSVDETPNEYDRKLGFVPIWYSNKGGIQDMKF